MIHRPYPSLPAFSLADKKKPSIEGLKRPPSLSTKQGDQSSVKMREEYTSYVFLDDDGGAAATIEQATHAYYLTVVKFSTLLSFSAAWHPVVAVAARVAVRCAFIGPLSSAH